jgi:hypothetical protein
MERDLIDREVMIDLASGACASLTALALWIERNGDIELAANLRASMAAVEEVFVTLQRSRFSAEDAAEVGLPGLAFDLRRAGLRRSSLVDDHEQSIAPRKGGAS